MEGRRTDWLLNSEPTVRPLPIPADLGSGEFELAQVGSDLRLSRAVLRLLPHGKPDWLSLGNFAVDLGTTTFFIHFQRGGLARHQELDGTDPREFGEGAALVGLAAQREVWTQVRTGSVSTAVSLHLSEPLLRSYLGAEEMGSLQRALGLEAVPSLAVRRLPDSLATPLFEAWSRALTGAPLVLFWQAKTLEFLSGLLDHVLLPAEVEAESYLDRRIEEVHHYLVTLSGKIPALRTLAEEFGLPAKKLNELFARRYGETIASYIVGRRLEESRIALMESPIPMKLLASRLGYSHVNHFIYAFRRRFGVSPGSLRR